MARKSVAVIGILLIAVILLYTGSELAPGPAVGVHNLVGDDPDCFDPDLIASGDIPPPDPNAEDQYLYVKFAGIPTSAQRSALESQSSYRIRFLTSQGGGAYTVGIRTQPQFSNDLKALQDSPPTAECIAELKRSNRSSDRFDGNLDMLPGFDPDTNGTPQRPSLPVYVKFFDNVPVYRQRQILQTYSIDNIDQLETINDEWRVRIPIANLDALRDDRRVQWVEPVEEAPAEDLDAARPAIDLPESYHNGGDGTVIAQWEICHPANATPHEHPDIANRSSTGFATRLCNVPNPANAGQLILPDNDHATQVAGIIIGNGDASNHANGSANQWRGMAPESLLVSYSVADQDAHDFNSEYRDAARKMASISNNSWGPYFDDYYHRPLSKIYPKLSQTFDMLTSLRNSSGNPAGAGRRILIVASAGNRGGDKVQPDAANSARYYWSTIRVRNSAKNVLTVGNIASGEGANFGTPAFDTGRGPTGFGRLKPDLVAPGSEVPSLATGDSGIHSPVHPTVANPARFYESGWGTSFSTPIVAGSAALLNTTIREGACQRNPTPAELRALLINTAFDLTDASNEASADFRIADQNPDQMEILKLELASAGDPVPRNLTFPPYVLDDPPADLDELVGPDYVFGYGMVRPAMADAFAAAGHFLRASIDRGFVEFPITVSQESLEDSDILRITLAWDDPPYAINSVPDPETGILQNDLDLVVIDPNGRRHHAWQLDPENPAEPARQVSRSRFSFWPKTLGDHANTVEQVAIQPSSELLDRTWRIRVYGALMQLPPQEFSLASSIIRPAVPCGVLPIRTVKDPAMPPSEKRLWILFVIAVVTLAILLLWLAEVLIEAYSNQASYVSARVVILTFAFLLLVGILLFTWSGALMTAI